MIEVDEDEGNRDELLEKLDGLLKRGRAEGNDSPPPILQHAVPVATEGPIPTLTEAVSGPGRSPEPPGEDVDAQQVVATRLADCADKEIANLLSEYPEHSERLGALRRTIAFALPQLVVLRWQDSQEPGQEPATAHSSDPDGLV